MTDMMSGVENAENPKPESGRVGLDEQLASCAGLMSKVISLAGVGLTTGEIFAHLAGIYGAEVSRQNMSAITDKVLLHAGRCVRYSA